MKLKNLSMLFVLLALQLSVLPTSVGAQATRHAVILEIATGNWSQYGPGAALGADQLHASPASVGIVQHHQGDALATPDANARCLNYYGVNNFPTAFFDGTHVIPGGGNTSQSMYPAYQQAYNQAIALPTPYELSASWVQNGASIDVTVNVSQLGPDSSSALRVQAVLTESYIPENWFGLSECNFVNRAMYPDTGGQPVTLVNGGPAQTLTFNMPIDPAWVQSNMELVVWIEDGLTQEIFNGRYMPLGAATYATDIQAVSVENEIGATSCVTSISPQVRIRNLGNAPLTSVNFTYNVNGGAPMNYAWPGNVPFLGYAVATLPTISFSPAGTYTLTVSITNAADSNMTNNVVTKSWGASAAYNSGTYVLTIQPDHFGSDNTWEIKNTNGNIIATGGPYSNTPLNGPLPNAITRNIAIPPHDCYELIMHDSYGDGMCCTNGNGFYTLFDPLGNIVVHGGTFTFEENNMWEATTPVAIAESQDAAIKVYPNPTRDMLNVVIPGSGSVEISIVTLAGQVMHRATADTQTFQLDLATLASGMYLLRVQGADGLTVQKITKL